MFKIFYRDVVKRLIDLSIAIATLIVVSPILVVTAILVRLDSRGPVLFVQDRLGKDGTVFRAYKFRTMTDEQRISTGEVVGKTDEVTRAGYWLRRFKIDELPQLWNIVTGDMSLVGPRPALPSQMLKYDDQSRRRLLVRPGLTGLAQVNGNIHLSWPERWVYDCQYVDELSFAMDVRITLRTIGVILLGEEFFLQTTDVVHSDSDSGRAKAA